MPNKLPTYFMEQRITGEMNNNCMQTLNKALLQFRVDSANILDNA